MTVPASTWRGLFYGFIGIACFSLTTPFTKLALVGFSPYFVTAGRVALAGLLAAAILYVRKVKVPERKYWKKIALVSAGTSIGFPFCLSMALTHTDASHAGIVMAILPLLTSIFGSWVNKERHSNAFWFIAMCGCLTVLAYTFWRNGVKLEIADLWLLAASCSAAVAYTMGGTLSKHMGGLNTICWAVAAVLPLSLPLGGYLFWIAEPLASLPFSAIAAFIYLSLISQLLGFVPWYAGLSLGGIVRVSQVQLMQTFLTLFAASFFLGEVIEWHSWVVASLVIFQVYLTKIIK